MPLKKVHHTNPHLKHFRVIKMQEGIKWCKSLLNTSFFTRQMKSTLNLNFHCIFSLPTLTLSLENQLRNRKKQNSSICNNMGLLFIFLLTIIMPLHVLDPIYAKKISSNVLCVSQDDFVCTLLNRHRS